MPSSLMTLQVVSARAGDGGLLELVVKNQGSTQVQSFQLPSPITARETKERILQALERFSNLSSQHNIEMCITN